MDQKVRANHGIKIAGKPPLGFCKNGVWTGFMSWMPLGSRDVLACCPKKCVVWT